MKRLLTVIALISASLFAVPVSAHTLVRDGSIGAVLHIAPNDDPVAKEPARIGFSVSDSERQFSARSCNCQLIILKGSQTLTTINLSESLGATYTFPDTGLYTVRLVGTAKDESFSRFTIDQSVRVSQVGGANEWPLGRVVSAILLDALLIAIFVATIHYHRKFAPVMNKGVRI